MRIVIVGQRNGRLVIRWPQYLGLSFALSMVVGGGSGAVFYLLAGRWSHETVLYGIAIGLGIAVVGLIKGLRAPLESKCSPSPLRRMSRRIQGHWQS